MSNTSTQYTLRYLFLVVTFAALVSASLAALPPFPKFLPGYPKSVFLVSALAALLPYTKRVIGRLPRTT